MISQEEFETGNTKTSISAPDITIWNIHFGKKIDYNLQQPQENPRSGKKPKIHIQARDEDEHTIFLV